MKRSGHLIDLFAKVMASNRKRTSVSDVSTKTKANTIWRRANFRSPSFSFLILNRSSINCWARLTKKAATTERQSRLMKTTCAWRPTGRSRRQCVRSLSSLSHSHRINALARTPRRWQSRLRSKQRRPLIVSNPLSCPPDSDDALRCPRGKSIVHSCYWC